MASPAHPQLERDPVKLDPKHYSVELENDQTRVVRIKYRGHEKSPMHQHSRGVVVFSARPISNSLFQTGKP